MPQCAHIFTQITFSGCNEAQIYFKCLTKVKVKRHTLQLALCDSMIVSFDLLTLK